MAGTGESQAGPRDGKGRGEAPVSVAIIVFFTALVVVWTVAGIRSIQDGPGLTTVFWFALALLNLVQVAVLISRNRQARS